MGEKRTPYQILQDAIQAVHDGGSEVDFNKALNQAIKKSEKSKKPNPIKIISNQGKKGGTTESPRDENDW